MPVLRYVHQLFNVDQCQAYIHTLRWKDRPLQCLMWLYSSGHTETRAIAHF